jgi:hypothetical protein
MGPEAGPIVCGLLRDIFGNPFRPVAPDPSWLGRDGGIKLQARTLYDSARFNELSALAESLASEGCQHPLVLDHCRGPGAHVRGCWVIDMLVGRT